MQFLKYHTFQQYKLFVSVQSGLVSNPLHLIKLGLFLLHNLTFGHLFFAVTMQYQPPQIPIAAKPVVPQQTQAINLSTALNHQQPQHQPLGAAAITLPAAQGVSVGATALNQPAVGAATMTLPSGQIVIQGGATTLQVKIEVLRFIYIMAHLHNGKRTWVQTLIPTPFLHVAVRIGIRI